MIDKYNSELYLSYRYKNISMFGYTFLKGIFKGILFGYTFLKGILKGILKGMSL